MQSRLWVASGEASIFFLTWLRQWWPKQFRTRNILSCTFMFDERCFARSDVFPLERP